MNVKKFLRSANRGVIVGIILVIVLAVYVMVDNFIFQSEKGDIKIAVTDYIEDYAAIIKDSDDVIKTGVWTEELADTKKQAYIDLADKHFTDHSYKDTASSYLAYTTLDDVSTYLVSAYNIDTLASLGTITDCSYSTGHFSIDKYGPNGALVSLHFEAYIKTNGAPNLVGPNLQPVYEIGDCDDEGNELSKKNRYSYTISQNVTLQLLRENGTWKLSKVGLENTDYSFSKEGVKK